jgi:hypothetical protein
VERAAKADGSALLDPAIPHTRQTLTTLCRRLWSIENFFSVWHYMVGLVDLEKTGKKGLWYCEGEYLYCGKKDFV